MRADAIHRRLRRYFARLEQLESRFALSALGGTADDLGVPVTPSERLLAEMSPILNPSEGAQDPDESGPAWGAIPETTTPILAPSWSRPVADPDVDPTSVATPTVTLVGPAPGSLSTVAPESLVLAFKRPINPVTLGPDVVLAGLDAQGNRNGWAYLDLGTLDGDGSTLAVAVPRDLGPGRYRVLIADDSNLMDVEGNRLIVDDQPLVVGEFEIGAAPSMPLDTAIDLGPLGAGTGTTIRGNLDFQADPTAVALYKIILPAGAFWRLELEVTAQRDGSALDSALALFDAEGRPLATAEVGRSDAPYDPHLVAGLEPGVYYIGVSGMGNLPGVPGGYDPDAGLPGSIFQDQEGGPFTLHLAARPVEGPAQVLDFADSGDGTRDGGRIGFTLVFSDGVRAGDPTGGINGAIEVVDQDGRPWAVEILGIDESGQKLSYLFRKELPEGQYTVRLAGSGRLVDLVGLAPVAPGRPAGVLGTFAVAARSREADPFDLGVILPDEAAAGVVLEGMLAPGQAVEYRLVVTLPSIYTFQGGYTGAGLSVRGIGPDGTTVAIKPGEPGGLSGTNDAILGPGEYLIRLGATGAESVTYRFTFRLPDRGGEIVPTSGLGQDSALTFHLGSPPTSTLPPLVQHLANEAVTVPVSYPGAAATIGFDRPLPSAPPVSTVRAALQGGAVPARSVSDVTTLGISLRASLDLGNDFIGRPQIEGRTVVATLGAPVPSGPLLTGGPGQVGQDVLVATGPVRRSLGRRSRRRDHETPIEPSEGKASAASRQDTERPEESMRTDRATSLARAEDRTTGAEGVEGLVGVLGRRPATRRQDFPEEAEGRGPSPTDPGVPGGAVATASPADQAAGADAPADGRLDGLVFVGVGLATVVIIRSRRRIDQSLSRFLAGCLSGRLVWRPMRRPSFSAADGLSFGDPFDLYAAISQ
ncbi:MAG TPA: hypothetical protein VF590_27520 [Isosphaeraceae bacterium]